mgnify:CR=1 FL=1
MSYNGFAVDFEEFRMMVEKEQGNPTKEKLAEFGKAQADSIGKQVKELEPQFREIMKDIEAEMVNG